MSDELYAVGTMISVVAAAAALWSRIRVRQITRRLERSLEESRRRAAEAQKSANEKPRAGE